MKKLKIVFITILLALNQQVYAGARGFVVAFIDISDKPYDDGKQVALKLRKDRNFAQQHPNCVFCETPDDAPGTIGTLYIENVPQGITKELAKNAIYNNNVNALKSICTQLTDFKDPKNNTNGLDGVFFYSRDKNGVTIYAIGSHPKKYKFNASYHSVKKYISSESLDKLFADTSSAFWEGFRL